MIHEVIQSLNTELAAKGAPLRASLGPEPTGTTTWGRPRIVIEHDGKETFSEVRRAFVNPKQYFVRNSPFKLTIYAQSTKRNALDLEHRRVANIALQTVLVALHKITRVRRNRFTPVGGEFIVPKDLAASEVQSGAVYELSFTITTGVADETWTRDAVDEVTIAATADVDNGEAALTNEDTVVSLTGVPDDDDNPNTPLASAESALSGA